MTQKKSYEIKKTFFHKIKKRCLVSVKNKTGNQKKEKVVL